MTGFFPEQMDGENRYITGEVFSTVIRKLKRSEIRKIWEIDRSEVIDRVYHFRDDNLVLETEFYEMKGWHPGEPDWYTPMFLACFDRGGSFFGDFENQKLVGVALLDNRMIGKARNQLQLMFLHVDRSYRGSGLGRRLFEKVVARARELGAEKLYVSATPAENTVNFYFHLGCRITRDIDRELFKMEPEDIHLEYDIPIDSTPGAV